MIDGTELLRIRCRRPKEGGTFSEAEKQEENAGRSNCILSTETEGRRSPSQLVCGTDQTPRVGIRCPQKLRSTGMSGIATYGNQEKIKGISKYQGESN